MDVLDFQILPYTHREIKENQNGNEVSTLIWIRPVRHCGEPFSGQDLILGQ